MANALETPVEELAAGDLIGALEAVIEKVKEKPILALSVAADDLGTQACRVSETLAAAGLGVSIEMTEDGLKALQAQG
jgi:hypothetical protein